MHTRKCDAIYPAGGNQSVTGTNNFVDCCWIDRGSAGALHRSRQRPNGLHSHYLVGSSRLVSRRIHQQFDLAPGERKLLSPCRHYSLAGWGDYPTSHMAKVKTRRLSKVDSLAIKRLATKVLRLKVSPRGLVLL